MWTIILTASYIVLLHIHYSQRLITDNVKRKVINFRHSAR